MKRSFLNFIIGLSWYAGIAIIHKSMRIKFICLTIACLFTIFERLTAIPLINDNKVNTEDPYISKASTQDTITASVLSTGRWYRVKINKTGIYKLTYSDISEMGFSDPENVRIYGNGGKMLPAMNNEPRNHDLIENAVYMYKGSDNIFNTGDYILFFGLGPVSWSFNPSTGMYEHTKHLFSNASYYYLTTLEGGKRIAGSDPVTGTPVHFFSTFDAYDYHERDRYNFLKSGRQWFGERIDLNPYDTVFSFPDIAVSSPVKLKANVISRSATQRTVTIRHGSNTIGTINLAEVILSNSTGIYADQKSSVFSFTAAEDNVPVSLSYNKAAVTDEGFIDYIIVNAKRNLSFTGEALFFRNRIEAPPEGSLTEYSLQGAEDNVQIWDITDIYNIRKVNTYLEGTSLKFKAYHFNGNEYVAVKTTSSFPSPVTENEPGTGLLSNQNLHGAGPHQMLIVTHPLFEEAADSIARLHRENDGLSVYVATTEQIYNEFSSGATDISAIRDFARMIYSRATGEGDKLKYLLLIGDGSYNNISRSAGNSNYIPTYQSENSLNASASYVTDDFYGFMDLNEGGSEVMESYFLDLGVGRLPVKTPDEAMAVYRKIKSYAYRSYPGDWRNNILVIGDDEDANMHMQQANEIADLIGDTHPEFAVKKVLLDAYKQTSTSSGTRYPDVNRIIYESLLKGILIFNYTGHGGERGLSAEQILMRDDIRKLTNTGKYPLFVTATCEFSRFDDLLYDGMTMLESTSAGEVSLLNEKGGSIGLITTTRIVYSDRNHFLNKQIYRFIFERDNEGNRYRLGDVIRLTKDSTGVEKNKLNFILLGDPALTLAIPDLKVATDSLNGIHIEEPIDTLKAFSRIRISGHIENEAGVLQENYSGVVYPAVYDKATTIQTLANDGGDAMEFAQQEKIIFKGKAEVTDGRFSFEFIVPKDISYSMGSGRVLYYAGEGTGDAHGVFKGFTIGGTDPSGTIDNEGPFIELFLNDEKFHDMGITNASPVIYAKLYDESGINTTGNGIGHDITGIIDNNTSSPVILNDFYETSLGDFTRGTILYPMKDLEEGWHSLTVKAWDVFNNSSDQTIEFRVIPSDKVILSGVINYPNPATNFTYFRFENNRAGEELYVTIEIYDMSGRLTAIVKDVVTSAGFISEVLWDLRDINGNKLRQGFYPYRIVVRDTSGRYAEGNEKLIVTEQ